MSKYLLIESRDPFEAADVPTFCQLARDLAGQGNDVTFFLIQNGALMARPGAKSNPLATPAGGKGKLEVLADDFSLRERGIKPANLAHGIQSSTVDHLVDLLAQPSVKAIWH